MPTTGNQSAINGFLRRVLVDMERLRVELRRKGDYPSLVTLRLPKSISCPGVKSSRYNMRILVLVPIILRSALSVNDERRYPKTSLQSF